MAGTLSRPVAVDVWARAFAPVLAGLILLGAVFHEEAAAAVHVWRTSTAYNHCFLVLPIAAWLAWDRRDRLAATPVRAAPLALLAALPLGLIWFAADRIGVMEGRQIAAMGFVEVLVAATLGPLMWRAFAAPLLYLFFLVPFGAFLTPSLQHFTVRFIVTGLNLLGIPNFSDGFRIDIPEGSFYVAQACAGLRFLVASVAFGVLYACMMYRSMGRRVLFVLAATVVPVVANGVRALGIVCLGHWLGSAEAAATDHVLYGWLFFSIVTVLLILAGLPFRQPPASRPAPALAFPDLPRPGAFVLTALLSGLAAAGPLAASVLDHAGPLPRYSERLAFVSPPGCKAEPQPVPSMAPQAGHVVQHFVCGEARLVATLDLFPSRAGFGAILARQKRLAPDPDPEESGTTRLTVPGAEPPDWRLVLGGAPRRAVASALWLEGMPTHAGLRSRVARGWNSVTGNGGTPALVTVSVETGLDFQPGSGTPRLLPVFLLRQAGLWRELARLSGQPGAGCDTGQANGPPASRAGCQRNN